MISILEFEAGKALKNPSEHTVVGVEAQGPGFKSWLCHLALPPGRGGLVFLALETGTVPALPPQLYEEQITM